MLTVENFIHSGRREANAISADVYPHLSDMFFLSRVNEDMLGLRCECAWGKLQYRETRSAVERKKRYFVNCSFLGDSPASRFLVADVSELFIGSIFIGILGV